MKKYNGWVVIERAKDVKGQWIAHCLDFDVVSQGNNPSQALEMIAEATAMVLEDDIRDKLDPHARRAPEEYWDRLYVVFDIGKQTVLELALEQERLAVLAVQIEFQVHVADAKKAVPPRMPLVFEQKLAAVG